ncbi:hypothetical protein TrLO_g2505 [Triparma laevis f. longispina]|uniref:Uncharacterized protein n=1 Tax=Triparma laevis f. longispina TaxID=1714387 RepID=A0A9W7CEE4_9STRA|nr:hypothetical protein TrLO_g2505 [Triparma laevis f. longispina]
MDQTPASEQFSSYPTPPRPCASLLTLANLVTECATTYSVILCLITSLPAILSVHAAVDEAFKIIDDYYTYEKFEHFWEWTIFPLVLSSMAISFALKPRRNDGK